MPVCLRRVTSPVWTAAMLWRRKSASLHSRLPPRLRCPAPCPPGSGACVILPSVINVPLTRAGCARNTAPHADAQVPGQLRHAGAQAGVCCAAARDTDARRRSGSESGHWRADRCCGWRKTSRKSVRRRRAHHQLTARQRCLQRGWREIRDGRSFVQRGQRMSKWRGSRRCGVVVHGRLHLDAQMRCLRGARISAENEHKCGAEQHNRAGRSAPTNAGSGCTSTWPSSPLKRMMDWRGHGLTSTRCGVARRSPFVMLGGGRICGRATAPNISTISPRSTVKWGVTATSCHSLPCWICSPGAFWWMNVKLRQMTRAQRSTTATIQSQCAR